MYSAEFMRQNPTRTINIAVLMILGKSRVGFSNSPATKPIYVICDERRLALIKSTGERTVSHPP
jgi:hypothetical protein